MKKCIYCKTEIDKDATICPNCKKKQQTSMPVWAIILSIIVGIFIIANYVDLDNSEFEINENVTKEYIKVTKDELNELLDENAAVARDTYLNKYVEISGKLEVIDSELSYISVTSSTDKWDFVGVHCSINSDEQKNVVRTLKSGQNIIVKGKITDVGEIMGYYLDIDEIIGK